jgi:crotonobetainyl-CoA:carnitine CoA-transferase CaiB-like acyl-CoA transferase
MNLPLEGIKVLDFTHGVAGPYCTMVLGDLGCEVIKVEKPQRGDATRYMNVSERFAGDIPRVGGDYFLAINRNKRSLTVDFKEAPGRDLCLELARWADVAVQSFRPGVMERLGLDYAALKAVNPRLIYASLSAYGKSGVLAQKPGMDVAVQARAGVMTITGVPGSTEPIRPGASMADFGGGIYLATAVLTALFHRERRGVGQEVHVSLLDATMSLLCNYSVAVMDGKVVLERMGSGHPQLVPYQAFPTRDGSVVISAGTNKIYRGMCQALGCPALAEDARFRTNPDRVSNRAALVPLLCEITRRRTTAEWLEILERNDIPCAPVNDMDTAFRELQHANRDMVQEVTLPAGGAIHVTGVPFAFSDTAGSIRRPPPMLGEHTDEVLHDLLGMKAEQVEQLRAAGIV